MWESDDGKLALEKSGDKLFLRRTVIERILIETAFLALYPNQKFTETEKKIYAEILKGKMDKEVAETFHITERTVRFHLSNIFAKCGVTNRRQLMWKFREDENKE